MVRFQAVLAALGVAAFATCAAGQTGTASQQMTGPLVVEGLQATVGDTWTYRNFQTDTGKTNRTWVETVRAVDGGGIVTRRIDRLASTRRELPERDIVIKFGEGLYNFPLYVGKTWQSTTSRDGVVVGTSSYKVIANEVIDTEIGRVESLKIEGSFSVDGKEFQQLIWFAPSVRNVVKLNYTGSAQATELISYDLSD